MCFSEKDNVRRIGSDKIDTVRIFRAKFGRDGTIDIEKAKRKRAFKGCGKRRDF